MKCGCRDGAEPDAAAAEDRDGVVFANASAICGVEPDGQRLDEAELFEGEWCSVELFTWNSDAFSEGSVTLYAQCLIGRAGVLAAPQATGAMSAGSVRGQRYCCSFAQIVRKSVAGIEDRCGNFVPEDAREGDQRIFPAEGVKVRSAQSDHSDLQQGLA